MEVLQVISQSTYSAELYLNSTGLDTDTQPNYNVTCTSSIDDTSSTLSNHRVTIFFQNVSQEQQLTAQPLAPSTNYTCCLERYEPMMCSDDFVTMSRPLAGGLSPEVAGVIGGIVGAIVTLLLLAGITGIAIGTAMLLRRKR